MTDWNSYTVSQLRAKADEVGVPLSVEARKPDIVAAMSAWENRPIEEPEPEPEAEVELEATAEAEIEVPEPEHEVPPEEMPQPPEPSEIRATAQGTRVPFAGITRSFREGRASTAVTALQRELTRNGHYGGRLDGMPGEQTREAVSAANYDVAGERGEEPTYELLEALGFEVR